MLLRQEKEMLKNELQGEPISIVFDGTTREGEALAIVAHFMKGWKIERLV